MNRTLVKSPPELWNEVSEIDSLARHLGEFGEIAITRLDPEHTVAWEGENARGTVELEASGWGTKVTLNAKVGGSTADPAPPAEKEQDAPAAVRRSRLTRWFSRQRRAEPEAVAVEPQSEPAPPPDPDLGIDTDRAVTVLEDALENLGAAHHRPFSRG